MIPNISHKFKCIFIHIPKTAGTSIERKLDLYGRKRGQQDHRTIREIKTTISDSIFRKYFKFTFVRNPWARVFSWYKNVMLDEIHRGTLGIPSEDYPFKDFLKVHLDKISGFMPLKPQMHWIKDDKGNIPLDFIGKFENLEKDFSYVCDVLNIENKRLPKLIVGDNRHYSKYYDKEMKRSVAKKYAEEIIYFGYKF